MFACKTNNRTMIDHRPGPTGYTARGFNDRVGTSLGAFGISFTVRGKREF